MAGTQHTGMRARPLAVVVAGLCALASVPLLAAPAGAHVRRSATPAPVGYVALGDSYTAGPLILNQSLNPLGCLRSTRNYPHDAAAALGLSLTDISCSGATTANMANPQATSDGTNPPEFSALSSSTRVVTVGIGGNDIGFISILENCAALTPWGPTKVGTTCKAHYDPNGNDTLAAQINATGPKVGAVLQGVHQRAPGAKVFVVGYPDILPPTGSSGCWPKLPLTNADVPYLRQVELNLNAMLAHQAATNGATYVDLYTPSESHNACTWSNWVEGIVPGTDAAPVHPNATGMAGEAVVLEGALRAAGIS